MTIQSSSPRTRRASFAGSIAAVAARLGNEALALSQARARLVAAPPRMTRSISLPRRLAGDFLFSSGVVPVRSSYSTTPRAVDVAAGVESRLLSSACSGVMYSACRRWRRTR